MLFTPTLASALNTKGERVLLNRCPLPPSVCYRALCPSLFRNTSLTAVPWARVCDKQLRCSQPVPLILRQTASLFILRCKCLPWKGSCTLNDFVFCLHDTLRCRAQAAIPPRPSSHERSAAKMPIVTLCLVSRRPPESHRTPLECVEGVGHLKNRKAEGQFFPVDNRGHGFRQEFGGFRRACARSPHRRDKGISPRREKAASQDRDQRERHGAGRTHAEHGQSSAQEKAIRTRVPKKEGVRASQGAHTHRVCARGRCHN